MNNLLPPYFNSMKPKLPELCNVYSIRKPTFHLPVIRHEFARQLIGYKLLELLNTEPGTLLVSSKVHTHSFIGFKIYIKNKVIDSYSYICNKVVVNLVGDLLNKYKCYVVIDFIIIVVLVIFYFVYVFIHVYV